MRPGATSLDARTANLEENVPTWMVKGSMGEEQDALDWLLGLCTQK